MNPSDRLLTAPFQSRCMNRLVPSDDGTWQLPEHAHVIVHETADGN